MHEQLMSVVFITCLQAAMIDNWSVSDIQTDKVFRDIAEQQLGPILEVRWLGICTEAACRV
jgi:hypothetical protein